MRKITIIIETCDSPDGNYGLGITMQSNEESDGTSEENEICSKIGGIIDEAISSIMHERSSNGIVGVGEAPGHNVSEAKSRAEIDYLVGKSLSEN